MMPIKNEMGEVVLFLFSFKDITQSGGPGLGPSGDSNHGNCKSGEKAQMVRGLCPRSQKTSPYPASWDVTPPYLCTLLPNRKLPWQEGSQLQTSIYQETEPDCPTPTDWPLWPPGPQRHEKQ